MFGNSAWAPSENITGNQISAGGGGAEILFPDWFHFIRDQTLWIKSANLIRVSYILRNFEIQKTSKNKTSRKIKGKKIEGKNTKILFTPYLTNVRCLEMETRWITCQRHLAGETGTDGPGPLGLVMWNMFAPRPIMRQYPSIWVKE